MEPTEEKWHLSLEQVAALGGRRHWPLLARVQMWSLPTLASRAIKKPRACSSNKAGERDYVMELARQWFAYYLQGAGTEPEHVVRAAITRPRDQDFNPGLINLMATSCSYSLSARTPR